MNEKLRIRCKATPHLFDPRFDGGCLYILQLGDTDIFKIGISIDVKRRMKELQRKSPLEIKLIRAWRGHDYEYAESSLHYLFKNRRIRGEWFRLTPHDLLDIFNILDSGTPYGFEKN